MRSSRVRTAELIPIKVDETRLSGSFLDRSPGRDRRARR